MVEDGGPNRVSEWSADGRLLREFLPPQTRANDGWTVDPEQPGARLHGGPAGLADAVQGRLRQAHVGRSTPSGRDVPELRRPVFIRRDGRCYLACKLTAQVYRLDGDRWVPGAACFARTSADKPEYFVWHDANGDGQVRPRRRRRWRCPAAAALPRQQLAGRPVAGAPNQAGPDVWRLAPAGIRQARQSDLPRAGRRC